MTNDGRDLVGPWVIGVGESESGYKIGVKGQRNTDSGNSYFRSIDGQYIIELEVIGVAEFEYGLKFSKFQIQYFSLKSGYF